MYLTIFNIYFLISLAILYINLFRPDFIGTMLKNFF